MGIRGLTGFIDKNPELLLQHELCHGPVVLDGNNLYHYIYHACHVQSSFGGDYDVFRTKVISTFQSMRDCGITPYVVLDGAYTVDGRKLKTSLSRAVARISLVDSIVNGHRGQVMPVLAYETFIQVLVEMGVPHTMCQFEADAEIATLANQLKCSVISNDSDFYIFDLEFGFLPLDYVDFRPLRKQTAEGKGQAYLHCYKYHIDDLINSFEGLSRSTVPIFATLLGNDIIDARAFSTFYARFKVPKIVSKKFSLPPRMTKVISVLHWLHTQAGGGSISHIRDQLLSYISPDKRTLVGRLFDKAVLGYTEVNSFEGCDLFKLFTEGLPSSVQVSSDFHGYNNKHFPDWFLKAVCKGELTSHILNVAILRRVILLTQVEALTMASTYNISYHLRSILYAILVKDDQPEAGRSEVSGNHHSSSQILKEDTKSGNSAAAHDTRYEVGEDRDKDKKENDEKEDEDEEEEESEEEESKIIEEVSEQVGSKASNSAQDRFRPRVICVDEYTRMSKQLKKSMVEVLDTADQLRLPGLEQLSTLSFDERRTILYQAFGKDASFADCFPDKLKIFVLCIMSWVRSCDPKVTFAQFDSLILCVLFLTARRELKARKRKQNSSDNRKPGGRTESNEPSVDSPLSRDSSRDLNIEGVCSHCDASHLKTFTANLDKYHSTVPVFNRGNCFNSTSCHTLAQLQALLADACHLNRLLQQPLPNPRPAEIINGTLLYNLVADVSARPRPDLYVSLMFGDEAGASPLKELFQRLRSFFLERAGLSSFLVASTQTRSKQKRKKNKQKSQQVLQKGDTESGPESEESTSVGEEFSEFAASNKFSLLMLCD